jgi:hypothetical protein
MRLFDKRGYGFELTVLGYQFPTIEMAEYDSNWLNIRIDGVHPDGAWHATHASLLTYEAADLVTWLEGIGAGRALEPEEGFLEPCIHFALLQADGEPVLRTYFDLELRPKWRPADGAGADDFFLESPVSELRLAEAAGALRNQLEPFPQRARV